MPRHALLIAAIFVPYLILMVGLGCYIWKTGQPSRPGRPAADEDDPGPSVAPAAT